MHTPTPWRQWTSMNDGSINISNEHKEYVALLGTPGEVEAARIQADAALIVRAVNSYEAMKEALALILDDYTHGAWFPDSDELIPTIRRALALADGKE